LYQVVIDEMVGEYLPSPALAGHGAYIEDVARVLRVPSSCRVQTQAPPQRLAMRIVFGLAHLMALAGAGGAPTR
jgi:hypothetical protein